MHTAFPSLLTKPLRFWTKQPWSSAAAWESCTPSFCSRLVLCHRILDYLLFKLSIFGKIMKSGFLLQHVIIKKSLVQLLNAKKETIFNSLRVLFTVFENINLYIPIYVFLPFYPPCKEVVCHSLKRSIFHFWANDWTATLTNLYINMRILCLFPFLIFHMI